MKDIALIAVPRASAEAILDEAEAAGYDAQRTGERGSALGEEAGRRGARLVVLPVADLSVHLLRRLERIGALVIALVADEEERARARALGAGAVAELPWRAGALDRAIHMLIGPVGEPERGRLIAVWGPPGAPGRSTVALATSLALAEAGRRVILVDADTHAASLAPLLGMLDESSGLATACRLAGRDELGAAELARVLEHAATSSGSLRLLSGIARAGRWPELDPGRAERVLDACRVDADDVIVDIGSGLTADEEISSELFAPRRYQLARRVAEIADTHLAVGSGDALGVMRLARGLPELRELAPATPLLCVVNRVPGGAAWDGMQTELRTALDRLAGIDDPVFLPRDVRATDRAVAAGRPLAEVAPRSALTRAVERLVARRLLPPGERRNRAERGARPAARWRGLRGRRAS